MTSKPKASQLILALDVNNLPELKALVSELSPYVDYFKVGLELAMSVGVPTAISVIKKQGGKVFVDCKLNDIPNTVGRAVAALAAQEVDLITIHASAGLVALQEAVSNKGSAKLAAVTVLTSITAEKGQVLQYARLAAEAGVDGIVCSVQELSLLKSDPLTRPLFTVTPGIRPVWSENNDQKRTATPAEAVKQGADFLVIGRPITNPVGISRIEAVQRVIKEMKP